MAATKGRVTSAMVLAVANFSPRCLRKKWAMPLDLQAWLNDVEIQAVDTLDGKRHVVLDDIGNGSGYTHDADSGRHGLSTPAACRHNSAQDAITPDRSLSYKQNYRRTYNLSV